MASNQDGLEEIPFEDLGGQRQVYDSYSSIWPFLKYGEENSSYALRAAVTSEEDKQADTEYVNRGIAAIWYMDNLVYIENNIGREPESMLHSEVEFFLSDKDIRFEFDENFSEEDAKTLQEALEP